MVGLCMSHILSEGMSHVAEMLHQDLGKNLTTLACPTTSGLLIHDKKLQKDHITYCLGALAINMSCLQFICSAWLYLLPVWYAGRQSEPI